MAFIPKLLLLKKKKFKSGKDIDVHSILYFDPPIL